MRLEVETFRKRVIRKILFPKTNLADALNRMGFVQADPIRSPARAQDLILRQRVNAYQAGDLETQYPELPLEEYFLFAYGTGSPQVWQQIHPKTEKALSAPEKKILHTVQEHLSMHPRDLERLLGSGRSKNYWGGFSRTAKLALESLHDRGSLRVKKRDKGIRIYELAPLHKSSRSPRERFKDIVLAALRSMGPTSRKFLLSELRHFNYLEGCRSSRIEAVQELVADGRINVEKVDDIEYLSLSQNKASRIPLDRVRILAPFDPIVRDRERFEHLWGWEYRFEAYVPAVKRKLGYYAMPVLWKDDIIGWANATVQHKRLQIDFGYAKQNPSETAFVRSAHKEASQMAKFLGLAEEAFDLKL